MKKLLKAVISTIETPLTDKEAKELIVVAREVTSTFCDECHVAEYGC
ncbi:MAG: hypothetical protein JRD89_01955 [Deltaproteobacteria bacterium]|nr:hypothetical protein [Deltaproteobacteria bacterium]